MPDPPAPIAVNARWSTIQKLWANSRTLKIAFMDNPEEHHKQKIINAASQWLPYINLSFDFVDDLQGDIRIATKKTTTTVRCWVLMRC